MNKECSFKYIASSLSIVVLLLHTASCANTVRPETIEPMDIAAIEVPIQKEAPIVPDLSGLFDTTEVVEIEEPIEELIEEPVEEPIEEPVEEPIEVIEETNALHEDDTHALSLTDLFDYETNYDFLKRKVIQEAGNQGLQGMMAVAQVIYDRAYLSKHDWNQESGLYGVLVQKNQFAGAYNGDISVYEPTATKALEAVFVRGERVFDEVTTYFYNPMTSSNSGIAFMQAQKYVGTIGAHEFRTGWDEND